jgi:hypothetical protein
MTTCFTFFFLTPEPDADSVAFSFPFTLFAGVAEVDGDFATDFLGHKTAFLPFCLSSHSFKSAAVYFDLTAPQISRSDLQSDSPANYARISS